MIVAFSCETCGYGGYAADGQPYEDGDIACPQCGTHRWVVSEPDEVGYLDDDRELVQAQPISSSYTHAWSTTLD